MNTMKKNGGFTLVELIIVIAILAILSTGAIAGYSAYIKSANTSAVNAVLSDVSTSAVLANAAAAPVEKISLTVADNGTWTFVVEVENDNFAADFKGLMKSSLGVEGKYDSDTKPTKFTVELKPSANWESSHYVNDTVVWTGSWPAANKAN